MRPPEGCRINSYECRGTEGPNSYFVCILSALGACESAAGSARFNNERLNCHHRFNCREHLPLPSSSSCWMLKLYELSKFKWLASGFLGWMECRSGWRRASRTCVLIGKGERFSSSLKLWSWCKLFIRIRRETPQVLMSTFQQPGSSDWTCPGASTDRRAISSVIETDWLLPR